MRWFSSIFLCTLVAWCSQVTVRAVDDDSSPMFKEINGWLKNIETDQLNYGVAVTDVDNDGDFEMVVAGFNGPNIVLSYNKQTGLLENLAKEDSPYEALRDEEGQAIGVCACDVDGDGREEIYFLNTNQAYSGRSRYGDKLFKFREGKFVDLYADPENKDMDAKQFAGRSVACVDRLGTGRYGFLVATYAENKVGQFALIEMKGTSRNGSVELHNVAKKAGIQRSTGGRSIVVGPITSENGKQDIYFGNEGNHWMGNPGENFLFKNLGSGQFEDDASLYGIADAFENARGMALTDFDHDGRLDIIVGNWVGKHRLFMRREGKQKFTNVASADFEDPSAIRTLIANDFDNDGNVDVLMNNIQYDGEQPNRLFKIVSNGPGKAPNVVKTNIGEALEEDGYGTGGAVADLDRDGHLELLLAHGESAEQGVQLYKVVKGLQNNWIRFQVKTKFGAPARGATVKIRMQDNTHQMQSLDNGSGYLCQMEPVAHFGLGRSVCVSAEIRWPDGAKLTKQLRDEDMNNIHLIEHP